MTDHLQEHAHTHAPEGRCCSDTPERRARLTRARRLVVVSGLVGVAIVLVGVVIGGWVGAALIGAIAGGIAVTAIGSWSRLSLNDRLMRVAVVLFLIAVALVRAFPR